MLHINHQGVLTARTVDEFRAEIVRFAHNLGFGTVDTLTVIDHPGAPTEFICVDNIGESDWNDLSLPLGVQDPVMQHCKLSSAPIAWNSKNYRNPDHRKIYELASGFGLCSGVSAAMHFPGGKHFALCVHLDRDQSLSVKRLSQLIPELQMFSVHAQDAAFRLLLPAEQVAEPMRLTIMESDALCRVIDGNSVEQIANLLNVTDACVRRYLRTASSKLGCANEHQAALKALRLEIIY